MSVTKEYFGRVPATGQTVDRFIITDGDYVAAILTWGAVLHTFSFRKRNIVTSADDLAVYLPWSNHMGEVVGPFANRIAKGRFSIDGNLYQLEINNGVNHLHSGSANFGDKVWKVVSIKDNSVELESGSYDTEGGFPGNITIRTLYTLEGGSLSIHYTVRTDRKTVVNITNHAYFNLHGRAEDIRDHVVKLDCPKYLEVDDGLIPIAVKDVEGTDFDFTSPHAIGERRDGFYDHCFIFGERKHGEVIADGLKLEVDTDCEGMQLYTGKAFNVPGCTQGDFGPYQGFCLETSGYPDSPNREDFPSCILSPGEVYERTTVYTLGEVQL